MLEWAVAVTHPRHCLLHERILCHIQLGIYGERSPEALEVLYTDLVVPHSKRHVAILQSLSQLCYPLLLCGSVNGALHLQGDTSKHHAMPCISWEGMP